MITIDAPGVYEIPEDDYHSDPVPSGSLSSSGARKLLPPSCPALFQHWRVHGTRTKAMDFGVAAHRRLLGVGAEIEVVDADDWRTKAAQAQRDEAHAAGRVPLLLRDYLRVREMEQAIQEHPEAGALFRPGAGLVERSLFWVDQEFEVWCRGRLDLIIPGSETQPLLVIDFKTKASSVDIDSLSKSLATYGYDQQGAWYTDAIEAVGLAPRAGVVFLLVFQMSEPPYLVRVTQPDQEALQWGRVKNRKALQTYRDCTKTGEWPSFPSGVVSLSHPRWAEYQLQTAWAAHEFDIGDDEDTEVGE